MFEPVPTVPDFGRLEAEVLERWARHRIFERSVSERGDAEFVFFEGPPTANGRPGLHHVWARVYKDLFCRYQTMKGLRVDRRAGWDTHGLPVEVEVEKQLGFSGKDQIEAFGVAEFVERCRASVYAYVEDWERLTERIAFWVDTSQAYWTLSPEYVQSVWWHLRRLWDTGLLFEDVKVVPYCPRCGTALSSHELGQPDVYQDVEDLTAYVRFPLTEGGPPGADALVVWTTTPWTLVSNTAVAVDPDMDYVVIDGMVVAAALADEVLGEGALDRAGPRFPGSTLVGARYRRPFDLVEPTGNQDGWRVVPAGFVTGDEGTGLVHIAPAFGSDDWLLGRAESLPTINPVGPDGRFTAAAGWLAGRPVREADPDIVARLAEEGLLVRPQPHVHSYPHCWRCGTPLIYWGKPSWYVATSSHKDQLLEANEKVTWRPEHTKHGRFGEWLANNVDWALSRDRYWGTPLPIWRCPDKHARCVASLAELSELAGRDLSDLDPHRPVIDEVTFPCPECGETATRVEAVIDAWFDSGSMPAAQWGYPHTPGSEGRLRIPADFIAEAVDQTRGWFYSLLAVNVLVFGESPYRTVLSLGHIVDAEGRKMSKSLGNAIDPWTILETRGADPLRWWMFHQGSPWTSTRTSLEAIDASTSDVIMTLWNTWSFFSTYARLNDYRPGDPDTPGPADRPPLDRWAASRLAATVTEVTAALDSYQPLQAANAIAAMVDDLSNWYVRCNRRRFWRTDPGLDRGDSLAAHATLHEALVTLSLLLAPFVPFLADAMWAQLTGAAADASVHLALWPEAGTRRDHDLEASMELARRLVSLGRAARAQANVKVRQPLRRAVVVLPPERPELLDRLVAEELNVDEVVVGTAMGEVMSFELVPNFRLLGPRLGEAAKSLRPALARLDPAEAVERLERGEALTVALESGEVSLTADEVEIRVKGRSGFSVSREGTAAVALDLELDDELRRRGLLRDVIRQVQSLRRDAGLEMSDRIRLWLTGVDELASSAADISREVLALEVSFEPGAPGGGAGVDLETDDGRAARAELVKA
ncbi:MAG TPA: isoleucine--tRNA ligase [Acidimicrobiales bacterium]|nr:isoleucine--tRNA ligase [Acidimicrobiales bacterium]